MGKHTPGPWYIKTGHKISIHSDSDPMTKPDRGSICFLGWTSNGLGIENAHLISAAPELLEACKKLIMHKNRGDIHPLDYQRIQLAIDKAERKE